MQFRKNPLCSRISLLLATGTLLAAHAPASLAQSVADGGQWTCQADAAGNWQCSENPAASRSTVNAGVVVTRGERPVAGQRSGASTTQSTRDAGNHQAESDWVPVEQMTAAQRTSLPANCCGAFIEPARTGLDGQPLDASEPA